MKLSPPRLLRLVQSLPPWRRPFPRPASRLRVCSYLAKWGASPDTQDIWRKREGQSVELATGNRTRQGLITPEREWNKNLGKFSWLLLLSLQTQTLFCGNWVWWVLENALSCSSFLTHTLRVCSWKLRLMGLSDSRLGRFGSKQQWRNYKNTPALS